MKRSLSHHSPLVQPFSWSKPSAQKPRSLGPAALQVEPLLLPLEEEELDELDEELDELELPTTVQAASAPKQMVLSFLSVGARHASFSKVSVILLQHAASSAHAVPLFPLEPLLLLVGGLDGGGGVVEAGGGGVVEAGGVVGVVVGAGAECVTDFVGVGSVSPVLSSPP